MDVDLVYNLVKKKNKILKQNWMNFLRNAISFIFLSLTHNTKEEKVVLLPGIQYGFECFKMFSFALKTNDTFFFYAIECIIIVCWLVPCTTKNSFFFFIRCDSWKLNAYESILVYASSKYITSFFLRSFLEIRFLFLFLFSNSPSISSVYHFLFLSLEHT